MKCDNKECNKEAIKTVVDKRLEIEINVCEEHLFDLEKY